jgi:hypothetical protein
MNNKRLVSSLDIPKVKDMDTFPEFPTSGWVHFPYDWHDYQDIDGAHHFRIWYNVDKNGYYPTGKKYLLGKCLNKAGEPNSLQNAGSGEYPTLKQAFKAGVEWCKQDPQFLIKDKQNQLKKIDKPTKVC